MATRHAHRDSVPSVASSRLAARLAKKSSRATRPPRRSSKQAGEARKAAAKDADVAVPADFWGSLLPFMARKSARKSRKQRAAAANPAPHEAAAGGPKPNQAKAFKKRSNTWGAEAIAEAATPSAGNVAHGPHAPHATQAPRPAGRTVPGQGRGKKASPWSLKSASGKTPGGKENANANATFTLAEHCGARHSFV